MFKLRVVQAEYGDCLILEFGTSSNPRYILVDGGPPHIYKKHLRGELGKIRDKGGKLDLAIVSHVDNDHIIGLQDLMADLREQRANDLNEVVAIDGLWHNAFSQTIGTDNDIEARINTLLSHSGVAAHTMSATGMVVEGVKEGNQLKLAAATLGIPVNAEFPDGLILAGEAPKSFAFGNLTLHIVGPTEKNLEDLKKKWLDWLEANEDRIASGDPYVAAMADRSIPNLSSIMLLAESQGKKVLLTGDGRGDHLLQGLEQADLLDPEGNLHVDVLKLPHHGSDRNVTKKFFKSVTADKYVISANGKDGNPDLASLIWIVDTARAQGRSIDILVTNETSSTQKLVEEYDPQEYGYRLKVMKKGSNSMTLKIAT